MFPRTIRHPLLVLAVAASWALGAFEPADAQDLRALPGSITVTLAPAEASGSAEWKVLLEQDGEGNWIVDDQGWLVSGDTVSGIAPGQYAVAFRAAAPWVAPEIAPVTIVSASTTARSATFGQMTIYATVDDIPPLDVRHGDTLEFFVEEAASLANVEPHDLVERDISLVDGHFAYRPSLAEREQFGVIFSAGARSKLVLVTPRGVLPAEHSVIEFKGDFPFPQSAERKQYLAITDDRTSNVSFNHETQQVRDVTVSGMTVVFQRGHENGLFEALAYADDQLDNDNVRSLEVFADEVVFREPVRFAGTTVTIWAREVRFEDVGSSPASLATTPVKKGGRAAAGARGLPAGDVTLNVSGVYAMGGARRFYLNGGDGQEANLGADGAPLNPAPRTFSTYNRNSNAPALPNGWLGRIIYMKVDEICVITVTRREDGTTTCPRSGNGARANGVPGNGGDGGDLRCAFDLGALADVARGRAGASQPTRFGSAGDRPYSAIKAYNSFNCLGNWGSWRSLSPACSNGAGANQPATSAPGPTPSNGVTRIEGSPHAWLHPVVVRSALQFARDAYLNGYPEVVRLVLTPYLTALESVTDVPADFAADLDQLAGEIRTIFHRLDSSLDYFGFPAGWVPMLSFEITKQLFEDQVAAAGDLLYLTHYLGLAADQATNKVAAIARLRAELSEELAEFRARLDEAKADFEDLRFRAETIDVQIRNLGISLKGREEALRARAELNAGLKKAFRVAGNVLPLIPVGQPALGLVGAGLQAASKFNEQSAFDTAIDGKNLAQEFLGSGMEENFGEFEENADGADDDVESEKFRKRQQAKQAFTAGVVAVTSIYQEAQTWDSDVDKELKILSASDPTHKDLVKQIRDLNSQKQLFAEDMAVVVQRAREIMDTINQNTIALDNLNRDVVAASNKIDQEAFRYVKELEQRAKDRLLRFQYYLVKAYHYRVLEPYPDGKAFQLGAIYDHFQDNFTNAIPGEAGEPILDRELQRNLVAVFSEQIEQVTDRIVTKLVTEPPDQTDEIYYPLTQAQLEQLNGWDDSFGQNPEDDLRINLVDLGGLFDQRQENLRIFELAVETMDVSSVAGPEANVTVHLRHSGESLIVSKGETFKFNHYRTLETPPITWRAKYETFLGTHTSPGISAAANSLLQSLIDGLGRADAPDDLLLYSRPAARADLIVTKETLSDVSEMRIDRLVLRLKVDFSQKAERQADLELVTMSESGDDLAPTIVVRNVDANNRADGHGSFRRVYRSGEPVTLEAPPVYGAYEFARWTNRRGDTLSEDPIFRVTMPTGSTPTSTKFQAIYRLVGGEPGGGDRFKLGDSNADGSSNLSDSIYTLDFLFRSGPVPPCKKSADVTEDGQINIADPVRLLVLLFQGRPPAGMFDCREDVAGILSCDAYDRCAE